MIDKLVALEGRPLTLLQTRQAAYKSQVSVLGSLASKLSALQTAANGLSAGGVLGLTTTSTNSAFTATPGSSAVAGSYDVAVTTLASAAKWRSAGFGASDTVLTGSFTLTAGKDYPIAVVGTGTLADVAAAIRASGAPVSAVVLNDGTRSYLSVTALNSGTAGAFTLDARAKLALDPTGTAAVSQAARDAVFSVDGLKYTRSSNIVTDALPGTTLTLQKPSPVDPGTGQPVPETLSLANDASATQAKLQTFVDAYNAVMQLAQQQLAVSQNSNRSSTLAGDPTVRGLQRSLQAIGSTIVPGLGLVRSLADLGLKTQRDGTLTIDTDVLSAAIARDPSAVDGVFASASSGVAKLTSKLVDSYVAPSSGLLSIRQQGLNDQISSMDDQAARMQARIDAYRQSLVNQFTAMETVVGQYKTIGNFLTQQSTALAASKS
jgi:flagellar hook-associated protein 2